MGTIVTTQFAQKVMPRIIFFTYHREHKTERKAISSKLKPKERPPCPGLQQQMKPGSIILKLYAFDGICTQRLKTRRINGSQMRFKSGRFRVIRVEHWNYNCLLDNSCLFVRVLTLSQPHYVATVAYRKFFQNLVYWTVGTITETKTS
jgi:hypothetical protein